MSIFSKKITIVAPPNFRPLETQELKLAPYQRALNRKRILQYAEQYDPDLFGIIIVSYRDGQYWIIDGQHRVEVAKVLGIGTVWCHVIEGLTYEQEAEKFYKLNDRKVRLNANHKYHAKVEAKDKNAIAILNALKKYNLTYSKEGNECKDHMVTAVGTLQKIYKQRGIEGLEKVLEITTNTWNGDKESLRSFMLKGIDTYISTYEYDKDFLIKVLESDTPKGVVDRSKAYTNNLRRIDGGTCFHIAKVIRDMYEEAAIKTKGKQKVCRYKEVV